MRAASVRMPWLHRASNSHASWSWEAISAASPRRCSAFWREAAALAMSLLRSSLDKLPALDICCDSASALSRFM